MAATELDEIRQELTSLQGDQPKQAPHTPVFDFGLFILAYFFSLVAIVTLLLAVGISIGQYTALYAVPVAWAVVAWLRKAPGYALLITAAGVLFLAACSLLAGQLFDIGWDSNCYQKADTGMLAYGWNPFRQTMVSFASVASPLPHNAFWLTYQVENQPKASFIIGASFYALTGNILYGKVYNLASIAACLCLVAPMIRDAFRISTLGALLAVLFASVNPATLSQVLTYYNDGFMFQLLTIAAASFTYVIYKPEGRYAFAAKITAFLAVCLAINVKTSAALYCVIVCLFYYLARLIAIVQSDEPKERRGRRKWQLFWYFAGMALCTLLVLGGTTYVVNAYRYGNPLYGMLGENSIHSHLQSLMSGKIQSLPRFMQFFVSLFSPVSNALFTDISLKIPFTFSADEWRLAVPDAIVGGWGLLFSGIFLLSLVIILRSMAVMSRRRSRKSKFLFVALLAVIVPVFFLPYLFSASYYLQPFWLPMTAIICLFSATSDSMRKLNLPDQKSSIARAKILTAVLSALLIVNCVTGINYLVLQAKETSSSHATIAEIESAVENDNQIMDVTTISPGLFYGLIFNLRDEGITEYNFAEVLPQVRGPLLYYLSYNLRDRGDDAHAEAYSFLFSLNANRYLVVIAKQGACGPLDSHMLFLTEDMALRLDAHDSETEGYLAVIDTNAHIRTEQSGTQALAWEGQADKMDVTVQSAYDAASIVIGGTEYALAQDGYNIVVYDPKEKLLVDSVVINPDNNPVLSR